VDPILVTPPSLPSHTVVDGSLAATGDIRVHPVHVAMTGFPLSGTLIMTNFAFGLPDFDLCLVAPDGTTVISDSPFTTRQEEVGTVPINPGTYFLVVESYEGNGPYVLDV
jgi:hypothetical protein